MFFDTDLSNIFDMPSQARTTKTKLNKQDQIKQKKFCTGKEAINKTKRQPPEWKILVNDTFKKQLILKIHK